MDRNPSSQASLSTNCLLIKSLVGRSSFVGKWILLAKIDVTKEPLERTLTMLSAQSCSRFCVLFLKGIENLPMFDICIGNLLIEIRLYPNIRLDRVTQIQSNVVHSLPMSTLN